MQISVSADETWPPVREKKKGKKMHADGRRGKRHWKEIKIKIIIMKMKFLKKCKFAKIQTFSSL